VIPRFNFLRFFDIEPSVLMQSIFVYLAFYKDICNQKTDSMNRILCKGKKHNLRCVFHDENTICGGIFIYFCIQICVCGDIK
jgi:hypothetical protein